LTSNFKHVHFEQTDQKTAHFQPNILFHFLSLRTIPRAKITQRIFQKHYWRLSVSCKDLLGQVISPKKQGFPILAILIEDKFH